jgi:hypothetical protein
MADVVLTCGCKTVVTHLRGDRIIQCRSHHRGFVVTAKPAAGPEYMVREVPGDDGPAAA